MSNKSFKLKISEIVAGTVSGFSDEGLAQIIGQTYEDCSTDPNWANVVLMLHLDQEGGNPVGFIDETGKEVKPFGGTQIVSTPSKFGSHVGYFNGQSNSYLTVSDGRLALGSGDFTIEGWIHTTTVTGYQIILDFRPVSTQGVYLCLYIQGGVPKIFVNSADLLTSSTAVSINTWTHIACCKKSGVLTLFLNGNLVGSVADNNTYLGNTASIGRNTQLISNTNFTGYIDELRITKGVARYDSNPIPPTAAFPSCRTDLVITDTYRSNTTLLLNMNGLVTDTQFYDDGTNALSVTKSGNVAYNTSVHKFWNSSAYFSGGYLSVAHDAGLELGSGDFTIETWMYKTADTDGLIYSKRVNEATADNIGISPRSGGSINLYCSSNGGSWDMFAVAVATGMSLNTWYHIALTRSGSTWTFFVNGAVTWTGASSATIHPNTYSLCVGAERTGGYPFTGYLSDFRITKGIARYDSNPTKLLMHFDSLAGGLIDETGKIVSTYGNATVSNTQSKFGGYSGYFDGSGDYIQVASSPDLAVGTGDFTVEMWFYQTGFTGPQHSTLLSTSTSAGSWAGGFGINVSHWGVTNNLKMVDSTGNFLWNGNTVIQLNTWYHLAVVRKTGVTSCYLNGVLEGSASDSNNYSGYGNFRIGCDIAGGQFWMGYIDEIRILKGVAQYITNFTPPSQPYTYSGSVVLSGASAIPPADKLLK